MATPGTRGMIPAIRYKVMGFFLLKEKNLLAVVAAIEAEKMGITFEDAPGLKSS